MLILLVILTLIILKILIIEDIYVTSYILSWYAMLSSIIALSTIEAERFLAT